MSKTIFNDRAMIVFGMHLALFVLVVVAAAALNLYATPDRIWFIWVLAGWGIAVGAHGLLLLLQRTHRRERIFIDPKAAPRLYIFSPISPWCCCSSPSITPRRRRSGGSIGWRSAGAPASRRISGACSISMGEGDPERAWWLRAEPVKLLLRGQAVRVRSREREMRRHARARARQESVESP